jgi:hypothetical protein
LISQMKTKKGTWQKENKYVGVTVKTFWIHLFFNGTARQWVVTASGVFKQGYLLVYRSWTRTTSGDAILFTTKYISLFSILIYLTWQNISYVECMHGLVTCTFLYGVRILW